MAQLVLVLALVFSLLVAVFAVQNADPVTVHLLTWRFDTSLVIVILAAAALGAALLALLGVFAQLRLGFLLKSTRGRVGQMQKELTALENERARLQEEVARLDHELRSGRESRQTPQPQSSLPEWNSTEERNDHDQEST